MKAYWVCIYEEIKNPDKLKEYAVKAKVAVDKYSGKFLVRKETDRVNEGIKSPRTVVVEFKDLITAKACYDSKEYQTAHDILKDHCKRNHVIVEGN